jgi:hypothetical protein
MLVNVQSMEHWQTNAFPAHAEPPVALSVLPSLSRRFSGRDRRRSTLLAPRAHPFPSRSPVARPLIMAVPERVPIGAAPRRPPPIARSTAPRPPSRDVPDLSTLSRPLIDPQLHPGFWSTELSHDLPDPWTPCPDPDPDLDSIPGHLATVRIGSDPTPVRRVPTPIPTFFAPVHPEERICRVFPDQDPPWLERDGPS